MVIWGYLELECLPHIERERFAGRLYRSPKKEIIQEAGRNPCLVKGESALETGCMYLYIFQLKLILTLKNRHGAVFSCGTIEKPAEQIARSGRPAFLCFLIYYDCPQELSTDCPSGRAS